MNSNHDSNPLRQVIICIAIWGVPVSDVVLVIVIIIIFIDDSIAFEEEFKDNEEGEGNKCPDYLKQPGPMGDGSFPSSSGSSPSSSSCSSLGSTSAC